MFIDKITVCLYNIIIYVKIYFLVKEDGKYEVDFTKRFKRKISFLF